ncbi:MAG: T9SS type A sorting domain-containing protein [Bacteroidetes bacterium]|nr:T9SS type A sorting domain-containing protein [Bacteroidota bacterium]
MRLFLLFFFFCTIAEIMYAQPGSVDLTFTPGAAANQRVRAIDVQQNGKIILGGEFSMYAGNTCTNIARTNANGTYDATFVTGLGADNSIQALKIQPADGKIIISGDFASYNGISRKGIARLDSTGSLDLTFNPGTGMNGGAACSNGLVIQPDGKIIVAGLFNVYNGVSRNGIARVNTNGTLDATFNPGSGANAQVYVAALQADKKVVIGGSFTTFNGITKNHITRLDSLGAIDNTFLSGVGADNMVFDAKVLANGKILVGGGFTYYDNNPAPGIVRLNSDGTIDNTFDPGNGAGGSSPNVWSIEVQPDGKIILLGEFTTWNGATANRIVRLNADGSVDNTFNSGTGFSSYVIASALQPNGKVLAGGNFTNYNGTARNRICRVNGNLNPIAQFTTSSNVVCGTGSVSVTDVSANFPLSWLWKVTPSVGVTITTNTAQSTGISFSSTGSYSVQLNVSNASGNDSIVKIINVYTIPGVTATPMGLTSFCQGGNVQIISSTATSYSWSSGATTQSITASHSGNYFVTITDVHGCSATSNTVVVHENLIVNPGICMVTVDSMSHHNIIYWNKTGNMPSDTFLVYRDTANNNFALIGRVPYDSLSRFNDTLRSLYHANGDPNVSSWRYKIAVRDSCGTISSMSPFHQTLFIQNSGGNFSWNHYQIEGQAMPVPQLNNYIFERDNLSTGAWNTIQSLSASSTAYTDPNYPLYMATGNWRVSTLWSIICDPALRLSPNAQVNKSKSNVKNNFTITSVHSISKNLILLIAPNPVTSELSIHFSNPQNAKTEFEITDVLGKCVLRTETPEGSQAFISVNNLTNGVYFLKLNQGEQQLVKKFVKE